MIAYQFPAELMLIFNTSQNYKEVPEYWMKTSTISGLNKWQMK